MGIFTTNAKYGFYTEDADVELPLPDAAVDNSEEVEDAHSGQIDPDPIVDPVEESFRICAESEANFGRLMMAVGLQELKSYRESGVDYIHEAPNVKAFFSKAKEFFVTLKEKIWSVVKTFIAAFQSRVAKGDKFASKYGAQIKKGFAGLKDDELNIKGYKFTNTDWDAAKTMTDVYKKVKGEGMDLGTSTVDVEKFIDDANATEAMTAKDISDILDSFRGAAIGKQGGTISASEFPEELFKFFRDGKDEAKDLRKSDINIGHVVDTVLKGGNKTISDIKKNWKTIEKDANKTIKKISELEKAILGYKGSKNVGTAISSISLLISFQKSMMLTVNTMFSANMSAMKAELSQARKVALRAIAKDNTVDKKLFGESYTGSSIGSVSFI